MANWGCKMNMKRRNLNQDTPVMYMSGDPSSDGAKNFSPRASIAITIKMSNMVECQSGPDDE